MRASSLIGEELPALGADGTEPTGVPLPARSSNVTDEVAWLWKVLRSVLSYLLSREAVPASDIVVLSDSRRFVDGVQYRRKVAGHQMVSLSGEGVAIETIGRFKGLEAQVIVLLLTADWSDAPTKIANVYTGMTRARAHLVVIAPPSTLHRAGLLVTSAENE